MGNCRHSFMEAVVAQRTRRAREAARGVTAPPFFSSDDMAEAEKVFAQLYPRAEPRPVVRVVPQAKQEPATPRKLVKEHREKTSVMSWATLYSCTHWDCQFGTDIDGNWIRKTHSNKEVALPFDPTEVLVEDDQDTDVTPELGVEAVPVPVAGEERPEDEPELEEDDSEDEAIPEAEDAGEDTDADNEGE